MSFYVPHPRTEGAPPDVVRQPHQGCALGTGIAETYCTSLTLLQWRLPCIILYCASINWCVLSPLLCCSPRPNTMKELVKQTCNQFHNFTLHDFTPFVIRRHIWLGVKYVSVISYTHMYNFACVLPASQTRLSRYIALSTFNHHCRSALWLKCLTVSFFSDCIFCFLPFSSIT